MPQKIFRVQGINDTDKYYEVDARKPSCTCSGFPNCCHIGKVGQHLAPDRSRWVIGPYQQRDVISTLHKEIRRGDVEKALYWADMIIQKKGPARVWNYIKRIIFEETRNIDLWKWMAQIGEAYTEKNALNAVWKMTVSPKKWDFPHSKDRFLAELEGAVKGLRKPIRMKIGQEVMTGYMHAIYWYEAAYKLGWPAEMEEPICGFYEKIAEEFLGEEVNIPQFDFNPFSAFMDLKSSPIEVSAYTKYPARASFKRDLSRMIKSLDGYLLAIPPYAYDQHTSKGKKLLLTYGDQVLPGKPLPVPGGLDLRYTGAIIGDLWRHFAYAQFGTVDVPWEKVKIGMKEWELARYWDHAIA